MIRFLRKLQQKLILIEKAQIRAFGPAQICVNFRLCSCENMMWSCCKRLRNRFREFMAVNAVVASIKLV